MMQNPKISKMNHLMMTQLANVYSDPPKVSRDSSSLLASLEGYNLDPVVSQIYENDGSASPPILMFNGTIAMPYRGVSAPFSPPKGLDLVYESCGSGPNCSTPDDPSPAAASPA